MIDTDTMTYVSAVNVAIASGNLPATVLRTDTCPECQTQLDADGGYDDHLITFVNGRLIVVIGCEGYWVIDPNAVGIASPTWMSLETQAAMFNG